MHLIARLARLAVADVVWEDDKKLGRIERLPSAEKFAGKFGPDELCATAGSAVHA